MPTWAIRFGPASGPKFQQENYKNSLLETYENAASWKATLEPIFSHKSEKKYEEWKRLNKGKKFPCLDKHNVLFVEVQES